MENLACSIQDSNSGGAYKHVRQTSGHRRKKPDVLPSLQQKDGTMCAGCEDIRLRWCQHFTEVEAGKDVDAPELLQLAMEERLWILPAHLSSLPSEAELSHIFRDAKSGKAVGVTAYPMNWG